MLHKNLKPLPKDFFWGVSLKDGKIYDPYRIQYLREHIAQLQQAITDGAKMLGYNLWSAID